ncbi:MAG: hypothetical protein GY782_00825 [Gammaproteobacteria bacterium]|nr:hypothetical protein [Gammaproteobacteria bacterium]
MLTQWQESENERTHALKVKFNKIAKKTKKISETIYASAQKKYEGLLEEKGDILFKYVSKVNILKSLKSEYGTSELEELRKQIKSEKFSLEK